MISRLGLPAWKSQGAEWLTSDAYAYPLLHEGTCGRCFRAQPRLLRRCGEQGSEIGYGAVVDGFPSALAGGVDVASAVVSEADLPGRDGKQPGDLMVDGGIGLAGGEPVAEEQVLERLERFRVQAGEHLLFQRSVVGEHAAAPGLAGEEREYSRVGAEGAAPGRVQYFIGAGIA